MYFHLLPISGTNKSVVAGKPFDCNSVVV